MFRSLKIKFILLLLIGGTIAGMIGTWLSYKAADAEFGERLRIRAETLASAINHVAMSSTEWTPLQHMAEEVMKEQPDIKSIAVVVRSDRRVVVAAGGGWRTGPFDQVPMTHIVSEVSKAIRDGAFGHHVEHGDGWDHSGELIIISPLSLARTATHGGRHADGEHPARSHDGKSGSVVPENDAMAGSLAPSAGHAHGEGNQAYRGAILIRMSRSAASRGASTIEQQHAIAVVASILVILLMAYVALEIQIMGPIRAIRGVMERRRAGDAGARVAFHRSDEFSEVARALNETLDREDEQGRELMQINEQLSQSVIRSESASVAKSSFLANMSHELRTPLNAVIGFSEVIREQTFGPVGDRRYIEYAKDIMAAGQHLLQLINDILDFSKIEAEKEELNEGVVEVAGLVHSSVSIVRGQAERKEIEIAVELEEAIPRFKGDERKLRQSLINLLSNAVKFTPSGGDVAIRSWCREDSGLVMQVADTGIGIAQEDIPKALSQFGQVDSDLNRTYEGTGLGLPLTKALIELHGGSFDLQSKVGAGTTVTVRLPASRIIVN